MIDDVVALLQLALRAPHAADAEEVLHASPACRSRTASTTECAVLLREEDAVRAVAARRRTAATPATLPAAGSAERSRSVSRRIEPLALDRDPGERRAHVDARSPAARAELGAALGRADDERARRRELQHLHVGAEVADRGAAHLELAEQREVADAARAVERARERRRLARLEAVGDAPRSARGRRASSRALPLAFGVEERPQPHARRLELPVDADLEARVLLGEVGRQPREADRPARAAGCGARS